MSEQQGDVTQDLVEPEEAVEPQAPPVAGGQDDGPPAQGEGAEDSY